ncbi:YgaP family membrane protein [Variovorax sp. JS1663]|uniref:YgaP family membrane protein n=1 Tax=Variovorax sp. JS1663 TaxID=1851577 RepID=UPI000B341756|nr:DUF2892 domain-containing protein [Variovorax sp. JS1663]OUM00980.1 hypothetical protein A8M77_18625 [Variovorax sp. JS1663]
MIRNLGTLDRTLRIVAGGALATLAWADTIGPWGYLGVVPLLTGVVGMCPVYTLFGLNTCSAKV